MGLGIYGGDTNQVCEIVVVIKRSLVCGVVCGDEEMKLWLGTLSLCYLRRLVIIVFFEFTLS